MGLWLCSPCCLQIQIWSLWKDLEKQMSPAFPGEEDFGLLFCPCQIGSCQCKTAAGVWTRLTAGHIDLRLLSLNRLYTIWSLSVTLATPYSCPLSVLAVAVFCFRANKIMNLSCYPASKVSLLCNTSHCNLVDFEWQCEQILLDGLAMTLPELNHHPTELNHRLWCRIEKVHRDWQ